MNFETIWELMNTRQALYVYFALIVLLFVVHKRIKAGKIKLLLKDTRFKDNVLFNSGITTPLAVATDGYIGIIPGSFSKPIVVPIKDIKGFEFLFDGHGIMKKDDSGKDELVFKDIASIMEARMQEKTQKIVLALFLNKKLDNLIVNIVLFSGSTRLVTSVRGSAKKEIVQFLSTLEDVERSIKKK